MGGAWGGSALASSADMRLGNEVARYLGLRMIFGFESTSVDSPDYGAYFFGKWNGNGHKFGKAWLDASWDIDHHQAPSAVACGATQAEAQDRLWNEGSFSSAAAALAGAAGRAGRALRRPAGRRAAGGAGPARRRAGCRGERPAADRRPPRRPRDHVRRGGRHRPGRAERCRSGPDRPGRRRDVRTGRPRRPRGGQGAPLLPRGRHARGGRGPARARNPRGVHAAGRRPPGRHARPGRGAGRHRRRRHRHDDRRRHPRGRPADRERAGGTAGHPRGDPRTVHCGRGTGRGAAAPAAPPRGRRPGARRGPRGPGFDGGRLRAARRRRHAGRPADGRGGLRRRAREAVRAGGAAAACAGAGRPAPGQGVPARRTSEV